MEEPLDLRDLERGSAPNQFLACPPGFCRAEADMASPRFLVPVEGLAEAVKRELGRQPRTELVAEAPELRLDAESSSLAIYSRSNYGYGDFGVNERRVRAWLAAIAEGIGQARVTTF